MNFVLTNWYAYMGVLVAIVAQLAKLHLQEFVKDCQQPERFLYLCTFPVLHPVQHYLVGVCSSRSSEAW